MDTIIVLNSNRQVIDILSNNGSDPSAPFFDDIFKSELDTGAETYEFTTLANPRTGVTLEVGNYVLFKYNGKYKLFQIMETTDEHTEGKKLLTCYCEMAGMELLNDYCEPFTVEGNFITFLNTILQDTNWQVGLYSASLLDNIQTVTTTDYENVYKLIQDNLATFGGVEIEFRAEFYGNQLAALLIDCYEAGTRGNRTYRRFEYGEDVKGITRERNINDLATAVIGIGKNGLEFKDVEWKKINGNPCDKPLQQNFVVDVKANDLWNNGGKYIKTTYKSDTEDQYTLIQETWDYLQEIKQPKFDYDVDLALVAEDYRDISIGDTNYVVDFDYNPPILLEARVGTLELSFSNPNDNKCRLTNYKELTSILTQPVDLNTVGNIIQSHFPIQGTDIAMGAIGEGHINVTYYQAIKTDIVQAGLAEVGTLIADKADITDLNALNADIENLRATKAEIDDLNAANGNITNLTSQVGNIETLLAGNATAGNVQSIHLTSANATIDNAVIKSAMIDSVSADKVNTGTLNTNNVIIQSEDGGIKISGATQQFKDKEGHVRVQIGKDASGNFTFCLFSQDGVGILLDETGIKAGAVPDGLIVNDMVAEDASIAGSKLDIASVVETINGSTTTLNSSVIKFDDTGQSLLVAFNTLKNKVDTIENVTIDGDLSSVMEQVSTNTTQIGVIQGQITSLIQNTTITKADGQVVQLKDAYNQTVSKVDGNTTKIGTLETNYNKVTGDIESVTDRTTTLETNLSGVTARVTQNETDISSTKSTVSQHTTDISGIKSSITSLESTTKDHTTRLTTVENNVTKEAIVNKISDTFATTDTVSGIETRIQSAEQKLTKDGITNIVGDYYADGVTTRNSLSVIEQKADAVTTRVETINSAGVTNIIPNAYFGNFDCIKGAWIPNGVTWYTGNSGLGFSNKESSEGYIISQGGWVTDRTVSLYVDLICQANVSAKVYLIGSTTTSLSYDWTLTCLTYDKGESGVKTLEGIKIPDTVKTIFIQIASTGSGTSMNSVVFPKRANLVTGNVAKGSDLTSANQMAQLTVDTGEIKTEVSKKVGSNEIVSKINQSAESITIDANKVNLNGYVTLSNLTDGQTTISGENIKTGHIQGISLDACYLQGKTMCYIQDNGVFSCDGQTYIRDLYVPKTHEGWSPDSKGSFSVEPDAYFGGYIHCPKKVYIGSTGTAVRSKNTDLFMIDNISIQSGDNYWMKIVTPDGVAYGVNIWESDAQLKDNIVSLDSIPMTLPLNDEEKNNNTSTLGLDTVNAIEHYSFNFKPTDKTNMGSVECGYISQQLQGINSRFVISVPQDDGTEILQPVASEIIPYLSKAIKELSAKVEELENKIASMEQNNNKEGDNIG